MRNNLKLLQVLLVLFLLIFQVNKTSAQISALEILDAQSLTVCSDTARAIEVKVSFDAAVSGNVLLTFHFPKGVSYSGTVTKVSSSPAGLTISESDVNDASNPVFEITGGGIASGSYFQCTVEREANCDAYEQDPVTDEVEVQADSDSETETSITYNLTSPSLTIDQSPTNSSGVDIGQELVREFKFSNRSYIDLAKVYFVVDYNDVAYHNGTDEPTFELSIDGGTYFSITPDTKSDGKFYFTLDGTDLGADKVLIDNEQLTVKETVKVKACGLSTEYKVGWGCSMDTWCSTKTRTVDVNMQAGVAKPAFVRFKAEGTPSLCNAMDFDIWFTNNGSGGNMGGMYNAKVLTHLTTSQLLKFNENKAYIGNTSINSTSGNLNKLLIDFKDVFDVDPDGQDSGLSDLDGDGFFDDVAPGDTVKLTVKGTFDAPDDCGAEMQGHRMSMTLYHHAACQDKSGDRASVIFYNQKSVRVGPQIYRRSMGDFSYMPLVVKKNESFKFRIANNLSRNYDQNDYATNNRRFIYKLKYPHGLDFNVNNIRFMRGSYPSTYASQNVDIVFNNNTDSLVLMSPSSNYGYIDFTVDGYDCSDGDELRIEYTIEEEIDYNNSSLCNPLPPILCGSKTAIVLGCNSGNCTEGGQITSLKVERTDGSLGWTDRTLNTRQNRDSISSYDLCKALYLDTIQIISEFTQNGDASNLGARLKVKLDSDSEKGLTPVKAELYDATGTLMGTVSNTAQTCRDEKTGGSQVIDWDFTSLLGSSGVSDGSSYKVVAKYLVSSRYFPYQDEQHGESWFLYNSNAPSGTPVWTETYRTCLELPPEMYLVGTSRTNATNPYKANGCIEFTPGNNVSYVARRFSSQGLSYLDEYRPGMKLKKFYIEIPKAYRFESCKMLNQDGGFAWLDLSVSSQTELGDDIVYEFDIPNDVSYFDITKVNDYGSIFKVYLTPNCQAYVYKNSSDPDNDKIRTYFDYSDYYYAFVGQDPVPAPFEVSKELSNEKDIEYSKKPEIKLQSGGNVELSGKQGQWELTLVNNSASDAPRNWLDLPNASDLTILEVKRSSNGEVISPQSPSYGGGEMYHLSDVGVVSGSSETYIIKFKYEGCSPLNYTVYAGWNCYEYPTSPSSYVCDKSEITLGATPLGSKMEMQNMQKPNAAPDLCNEVIYVYQYRAVENGNVYAPYVNLELPVGLDLNKVEVEYPHNSNAWEEVNATSISDNYYSVNLLGHSDIGSKGYLPGVREGGDNGRLANIRLKVEPTCSFLAGSNFIVKARGDNSCNVALAGTDLSSDPLKINGAVSSYGATMTVNLEAGSSFSTPNCSATKTIYVKHQINSGTTSNKAKGIVCLPKGFRYVPNSYLQGVNAPASVTQSTNGDTLFLDFPQGLTNPSYIDYKLGMEEIPGSHPECDSYRVQVYSVEIINSLQCNGTPCGDTYVNAGNGELKFNLEKASLDIEILSATATYGNSGTDVSLKYKVSNRGTVALEANGKLKLFKDLDDDDMVASSGELLAEVPISSSDLAPGDEAINTVTLNGQDIQDICDFKLGAFKDDVCICSDVVNKVKISSVTGVKISDPNDVCMRERVQFSVSNISNFSYLWSGVKVGSDSYLSAKDVYNPTFEHNRNPVIADGQSITYPYALRLTHDKGCSVISDTVQVKVKGCTLPITLISFSADMQENGSVLLTWLSASEINNDYYSIYKSYDMENWSLLTEVAGAGNSSSVLKYDAVDNHPQEGFTYYKLMQTDYDGTVAELGVRQVMYKLSTNSHCLAYPNPTSGKINISGLSSAKEFVSVINTIGQVVSCDYSYKDSNHILELDMSNLPNGLYIVKTTQGNVQVIKK